MLDFCLEGILPRDEPHPIARFRNALKLQKQLLVNAVDVNGTVNEVVIVECPFRCFD